MNLKATVHSALLCLISTYGKQIERGGNKGDKYRSINGISLFHPFAISDILLYGGNIIRFEK